MKNYLLLISILITPLFASSQIIKGKVQNKEGAPMPFVNILLLNKSDSTLVKGAVSDATGDYIIDNIPSGKYLLSATMIGYKRAYGSLINIDESKAEVKAPVFTLDDDVLQLKDVTVETTRPFIEQEIDRMVVNVANSIIASGSTALEVLEKSPGVTIDRQNDGIALRGKQGVIVQIDGKQTYLAMADVVALLRNMPSDNIDKIELITNPSAKYDAAGNSGIINIRMKKNNNVGTNGSLSLAGGSGRYDRERGSFQINHRSNKLNLFANYSADRGGNYWNFELSRKQADGEQDNFIDQNSYIKFKNKGQNVKTGVDYFLSKNTTIGLVWTGFWNNTQEQSPAHTIFRREENGPVYFQALTDKSLSNISYNQIGNVNLQHSFGNTGGILSADFDIGRFSRDFDNNLITETVIPSEPSEALDGLFTKMPTTIDILTFKVDYSRTFPGKWKMESGIKSSTVSSDNDMTLSSGMIGSMEIDTELSNHFQYLERVNAIYTSISGKIFDETEMNIGLRTEHTHSVARSISRDETNTRDYLDLFPSLFVSRNLSKIQNLVFSYSYRIDRPNYQFLNPARSYLDPYGFSRGNPYLRPQYTHALELKHGFDNKIYTSIGANFVRDQVLFIVQPVDAQKFERTPNNIGTSQGYNINISFPVTIMKNWNLQTNLMGYYSRQQFMYQGEPMYAEQFSGRINATNSIVFGNGWTAELSGWLNAPSVNAIFYSPWLGSMDAGLQKSFGSNWKAKLSIQDLLHTNRIIAQGKAPGYTQDIRITFDSRITMLNLTYSFGNQQLKGMRQRRIGSEEEMRRSN
ncbi:MAG: TonB-dependent receptor family protein [Bacteroidota bacterium]|nr:TonB-dependent receptor family protein [Bacteroidota bacterium]